MRSAFAIVELSFALFAGSGAIKLAPNLNASGVASYDGSQSLWPNKGAWNQNFPWKQQCAPKVQDDGFLWCRNFAAPGYIPPIFPGRMDAALDPKKLVYFFYRGNTEQTMQYWWTDKTAQSFGRLCMRGVVECSSGRAKTDTQGGGGFYVYTRVATMNYKEKWGMGSVGTGPSAPWQLLFDRKMGDRLDWWHQGFDGMGKTPVGACEDCLYDIGPIARDLGIKTPYKGIVDSKAAAWKTTPGGATYGKDCRNNGCGGQLDPTLKAVLGVGGVSFNVPSGVNEQGFLGTIDLPIFLKKIVYVTGFTGECDTDAMAAREAAKTKAVGMLMKWNAAFCGTWNCQGNVIGACKGDLINLAYGPAMWY